VQDIKDIDTDTTMIKIKLKINVFLIPIFDFTSLI